MADSSEKYVAADILFQGYEVLLFYGSLLNGTPDRRAGLNESPKYPFLLEYRNYLDYLLLFFTSTELIIVYGVQKYHKRLYGKK